MIRQASRFVSHSLLGMGRHLPVALLNSSPLRDLLNEKLHMPGIAESIARKQLHAVAVTAFGYESGQAVTFYQGGGTIDAWLRHRRIGVPAQLSVDHLLASSAIPLLFAPVKIGEEYFGDGAVRQSAPISPALHLGASRVLVVGVSGNPRGFDPQQPLERAYTGQQPTLAQIGGHMLNSTFIDSLESDIELLQRLNQFSRLMPDGVPTRELGVAPVDVLVIAPSQPIDEIAARHRRSYRRRCVCSCAARGDQDQWGRGAELSAVRGGILQRADRPGTARCVGQARGVVPVSGDHRVGGSGLRFAVRRIAGKPAPTGFWMGTKK